MSETPELSSVEILRLLPGDVLVLSVEDDPGEDALAGMKAMLHEQFPEHQAIVTSGGVKLSVARDDQRWWENPSQEELADVHHALRMVAHHPTMSDTDRARYTELADGLWEGSFMRLAERPA